MDNTQAKAIASDLIGGHVLALNEIVKASLHPLMNPAWVLCDRDGTLIGSPHEGKLNLFVCDLARAGIPVIIASGHEDESATSPAIEFMRAYDPHFQVDKKPVKLRNEMRRVTFIIDDEVGIRELVPSSLDPASAQTATFLEAWCVLSEEDKEKILAPWVAISARYNVAPIPGAEPSP